MKDIIKPIAVLAAICLVVTALLAYINSVTAPIIADANAKAEAEAQHEVLTEADAFENIDVENAGLPKEVTKAVKATNGAGYVFSLTVKGYGGDIKLTCGIKSDGTIEATKTIEHSETSGIGSRVVGKDSDYRHNYEGKTAETYESVDALSGATISSKAYKSAVKAAFEAYDILTGEAK